MKYTNALAHEKSPYLQQHAHNPVNWLPWGEEAFRTAREADKPVLVSIGYSTCHWCHVMERESFEDEKIAALLNDAFVCVKVDREERPDVDSVYMTVCAMLTGSGGWPLNVVVTPEKEPFFAATYIPPSSKMGRVGLDELIPRLKYVWQNEREKVLEAAGSVKDSVIKLEHEAASAQGRLQTEKTTQEVFESLAKTYDKKNAGFGNAPKFPTGHNILFLLRHGTKTGNQRALDMAAATLEAMRRGGLWDHVGFGFHRYSTDEHWLLPHFEKMLYDQAVLATAYLEGYQALDREDFAQTARRIFAYVLRDLRDPQGGFYTAEDADSEGEEGLFYTWTVEQIKEVLSPEEAETFAAHYGIKPEGNFHEESTGLPTGRNIPHETETSSGDLDQLESAREKLFDARNERVRPHLDDKILTDMNGLMIAALARGGRVLGDESLTRAAEEAAAFILGRLTNDKGRLLHGYREGPLNTPGTMDDHAFMLWGLAELYEATFNQRYLHEAVHVAEALLTDFEDKENGGFFMTAEHAETVLVRRKDGYDGAAPSGNSVAVHVLIRLGRLLDRDDFIQAAERCLQAHSVMLERQPRGLVYMTSGLELFAEPPYSIMIAGPKDSPKGTEFQKALRTRYLPFATIAFTAVDKEQDLFDPDPYAAELQSLETDAAVWICKDYSCRKPITAVQELEAAL